MFKNIIPGLVSLDTNFKKTNSTYLLNNLDFFDGTKKKERFHYKLVIDNIFSIPEKYDFRSEYFFKKDGSWYYEKKIFKLSLKFKYDVKERTFYSNKLLTLVPFRIGGLIPTAVYLASLINLDLFLEGFINVRGCAFQYRNKNYCLIAPGLNGKTTFLNKIISKGGKYITEDNLLIDFLKMEVYPTSNSKMSKIFSRQTNEELEKFIKKDNVINEKQEIHKLLLLQNTTAHNYSTSDKDLSEFLILNSFYFLFSNLFIKSYIYEEKLTSKFLERFDDLKKIKDYEFVQIKDYNYSILINNL